MANLVSIGSGDWLTAGTWGLVDTTSYLNSETASATPPTSSGATARSNAFTPGAITIRGIAIKLRNRTGTTGTITIRLYNNTLAAAVAATSVTLNMSDLPPATTAALDGGWIVTDFANVLLLVANDYMVEVFTSSASQVILSSVSGNNWSRMLITSTTQAPIAGDDVVVAGNWTGAATGNAYLVNVNETAATDYGSNTTSTVTPAVAVCQNGSLAWDTTSAANPYLRLSGHLIVYNEGILEIGGATPHPRDSVAVLEFDCAADGDFGLVWRDGSDVFIRGLSRTSGKDIVSCKLNTDEAVNSTSLGADTDTGWLDNDQIAVASTTRTAAQCEAGTLNGNAGASSLTVDGFAGAGGGLAFAHSGTSPTQAEIILLTRNVKIRAVLSTAMTFVTSNLPSGGETGTANVHIEWAEFYYVGVNTAGKRGLEIGHAGSASGSTSITYCSIHDTEVNGFCISTASVNHITFSNNVMWNLSTTTGPGAQINTATSGTDIVIDSNILIRTGNGNGWTLGDVGGTFTNNTVVSAAVAGIAASDTTAIGTFSGNVAHSNVTIGINFNGTGLSGTASSLVSWRNTTVGFSLGPFVLNLLLENPILFGNTTDNIVINSSTSVRMTSPILNGDTTFATTNGIRFGSIGIATLIIDNGDFSSVAGIKTAHTNDINIGNTPSEALVVLRNTILGAATEVATPGNLANMGYISSQKHDQTAGLHKTWTRYGATTGGLIIDSVIFNTAAPSLRCIPTNATFKLESAPQFLGMKVAVASGATVTISVYVRKSEAADVGGVAYAGNQPRLIQKANPALGQNSDVVIDTMTVGNGTWEQLTGSSSTATGDDGTWEFVVDCDGTSGAWISVDDWVAS